MQGLYDALSFVAQFLQNTYDAVVGIFDFISNAASFVAQAITGAFQFFATLPKMSQLFSFASVIFHPFLWVGIMTMITTLISVLLWKVVGKLF